MEDFKGFDPNFTLHHKVALITGAGGGIGQAIVELLSHKGADIAAVDITGTSHLEELMPKERKLLQIQADITTPAGVDSAVKQAIAAFSRIDILINCAGVVHLDDAENLDLALWDATMSVNLRAVFMMSQAVGRAMIQNGGGKIVSIASQAGVVALDNHVAYCASKAAVISMTKVRAMEWAQFNINVNTVSPTVILTELGRKAWAGEVGERFKQKIPLRRFGYPPEVAGCVLFLCSDAANLITGENLVIDGGYTIQ